jgi:hypothetical protein
MYYFKTKEQVKYCQEDFLEQGVLSFSISIFPAGSPSRRGGICGAGLERISSLRK